MKEIHAVYIILVIFMFFVSCSNQPSYPKPPQTGAEVVLDVGTLKSEVPEFFTYHYRGKRINFLVLKVNDKVFSFLDACETCYPAKKGYRFDGGRIICRECNVGYPVNEIENGVGSCIPIRIIGNIREGKYVIPVPALEAMVGKF